ncbi:MAG: hypothetical protein OXI87_12480 [Albidovulum sp.]|nr:hypothetical protein [Albidovulum sp.]MDE0305675.1 hypothetical protein [Albidovulum sp.]
METARILEPWEFEALEWRKVVGEFDGGLMNRAGGAILLRWRDWSMTVPAALPSALLIFAINSTRPHSELGF